MEKCICRESWLLGIFWERIFPYFYWTTQDPFSLFRQEMQIFKYTLTERTLCLEAYGINSVYQKLELHGNIPYLWENKIIMILEHFEIFVRKTTSKSQRCCNVNTKSEIPRRKHNVVTMLVFGRSNNVGNTMLWQRFDNVIQRRDRKTTKTQHCYNIECQLRKSYELLLEWL